jgi:hypothetical protein
MSSTTIQPVESKTISAPTQKDESDSQIVQNLFSSQLEAMAKQMATQFNLPTEELMKMVTSHSISVNLLELTTKKGNKIKNKSKNKKSIKTPITKENRCMARVWGSGTGTDQCNCIKKDGDYCTRHAKQAAICEQPCMLDDNGKKLGLFCGRIDQFQEGTTLPPFAVAGQIRIEWDSMEFKEAIDAGILNGTYKRTNKTGNKAKTKKTKTKKAKKISTKVDSTELDDEDQTMLEQKGMEEDPNDSFESVIAEFGLGPEGDDDADEIYHNSIQEDIDVEEEEEEEEEEELNVEQWEHKGIDYLVDPNTHLIYNEDGEEIGKWGEGETKDASIPKN